MRQPFSIGIIISVSYFLNIVATIIYYKLDLLNFDRLLLFKLFYSFELIKIKLLIKLFLKCLSLTIFNPKWNLVLSYEILFLLIKVKRNFTLGYNLANNKCVKCQKYIIIYLNIHSIKNWLVNVSLLWWKIIYFWSFFSLRLGSYRVPSCI